MKKPEIDLSDCSLCGICVDLCPMAFKFSESGFVEVIHSHDYCEEDIDEVIKNCRGDCISWKESE